MKIRLFIVIQFLVLSLFSIMHAQTFVSGEVTGVWDVSGSPYYVTDSICVPQDDSLRIMPGVDVIFQGHYKFCVDTNAVLKAIGTEIDSITFFPVDTLDTIGWNGIWYLNSSVTCSLSFSEIAYGKENNLSFGIIYLKKSLISINHCYFHNNNRKSIYSESSSSFISESKMENCECGVFSRNSYLYFSNNEVTNCYIISYTGSFADIIGNSVRDGTGTGISINGKGGNIQDNFIYNNHEGVSCSGDSIIFIENNEIRNNSYGGIHCYSCYCNPLIVGNEIWSNGTGIIANGNPIIDDNEIINNGRGIYYNDDGSISITNNLIQGNTLSDNGAGIYCYNALKIVISGNDISDNEVTHNSENGVGIYVGRCDSVFITNNSIIGNIGQEIAIHGGGIYARDIDSLLFISENVISNNLIGPDDGFGGSSGAGIYVMLSDKIIISKNFISGNISEGWDGVGGGIYFNMGEDSAIITNNMFINNSCWGDGGGIYWHGSGAYALLVNNTIVGNTSVDMRGGGFSGYLGNVLMLNNIIYDNDADGSGNNIFTGDDAEISLTIAYCNINVGVYGDGIYWDSGNINSDPRFADTLYHIMNSSPCKNTGIASYSSFFADSVDYENDPRPMYGGWDIGADEFDSSSVFVHENKKHKPQVINLSFFPNPFNSSCRITTAMNSKIEIYDLNGKQIVTFEETPAIWQPEKEIGSGIYLIRATTKDGLTETKRIIYLR